MLNRVERSLMDAETDVSGGRSWCWIRWAKLAKVALRGIRKLDACSRHCLSTYAALGLFAY